MKRQTTSRGFTLLETMIGLLIFSIGLLGLASLQLLGANLTADAYYRTIATIIANDMIDRMRANSVATRLGVNSPYNNPTRLAIANPNCLGENSSGGIVPTARCNSTQMALHDFYEWFASLSGAPATGWQGAIAGQLPSGSGVVCIDSTPNDGTPAEPACDNVVAVADAPIFAIKIWWVERKDAKSPGVTRQFVTSFSL